MVTTLATPQNNQNDGGEDSPRGTIQRTSEQNKNRIVNSKEFRQNQPLSRLPMAANDNMKVAANDNEEQPENTKIQQAQARVERLRALPSQIILGAQEEAQNQIDQAEKEKPNLLRFMPAFAVASFKDFILDFSLIGTLPVIGTVVTFFCSLLIFFLLLLTKANGGILEMRFVLRRLLIVLVGFLIEGFIFGVNFFPFEVATVAIIYFMDRHLSDKQIAALQNITSALSKKKL